MAKPRPPVPKRASQGNRKRQAAKELLQQLLASMDIKDWDFVVIGDGSGSTWDRPCGWGSISVEQRTWEWRRWYAAMSHGTNNVAEIMAHMHVLLSLAERIRTQAVYTARARIYEVYLITDSQYCVEVGSRRAKRNSNEGLWASMDVFSRYGLHVNWRHIPRNSSPLHDYVDRLSKMAMHHARDGMHDAAQKLRIQGIDDAT